MTGALCFIMFWLFTMSVSSLWPPPVAAQESAQAAVFRPEEIEQLVAPIALYPDALLAQIFMASTYPLEVVEAARWAKANPNLKDQALEDALQQQTWDPSVKSLAAFPQVLMLMNDRLDWAQKLGDAFLAQQKDVMDAVQRLRGKAQAEGTLKTTQEQKVIVEQPAGSQTTIVKIEPASPQVVYVPTYNPTVVYGAWPYPAYPPYSYYPRAMPRRRRSCRLASAWPWVPHCGATAIGTAGTWTSTSTITITSTRRTLRMRNGNITPCTARACSTAIR